MSLLSRLAVAAVLGAVAVLLVAVLLGTGDAGAEGVLIWLAIVVIGLQGLVLAGIAYAIRLLRRKAVGDQDFQALLVGQTTRIKEQNADGRRRDRLTRQKVEKVGELVKKHAAEQVWARQVEAGRHLATQRQGQAWANLQALVKLDAAVPPAGGWAASPDFLLRCVDEMLARRPAYVVECGSGLSTLILSLAIEQYDLPTKVIALEHETTFGARTCALLERHGVARHAEVRIAPLMPTGLPDHPTPWYQASALEGLHEIGMLLIDGPPTATGPQARYPAVPLLRDRFADRCLILIDDMTRDSDRETAERWEPLLDGFDYRLEVEYEKHLGSYTRG